MKIFVTGKFGTGKSTFLNGLLGGRIEAEIGAGSPHIDLYTFEIASGSLTVYDSPGQEFNATSFLHWMREECNDVDMFFFCIQMADQVRPEDTHAISSLIKTFSQPIWDRMVFILTRANQVAPLDPRIESRDVYFDRIFSAVTSRIRSILEDLAQSVGHSASLASIPIVPVGRPLEYSLPGHSDWRYAVVDASIACVGSPEASR